MKSRPVERVGVFAKSRSLFSVGMDIAGEDRKARASERCAALAGKLWLKLGVAVIHVDELGDEDSWLRAAVTGHMTKNYGDRK